MFHFDIVLSATSLLRDGSYTIWYNWLYRLVIHIVCFEAHLPISRQNTLLHNILLELLEKG